MVCLGMADRSWKRRIHEDMAVSKQRNYIGGTGNDNYMMVRRSIEVELKLKSKSKSESKSEARQFLPFTLDNNHTPCYRSLNLTP